MIVDLDVKDRFHFDPTFVGHFKEQPYNFGFEGVGAAVYYRSYAQQMEDGRTETFPDTLLRVIEGAMTILKWHLTSIKRPWDQGYWDHVAVKMVDSALKRHWLPAGRHLQHGGRELVFERGAAPTQNCGFLRISKLSDDAYWAADMSLNGVGIGYDTYNYKDTLYQPNEDTETYVVPDTREGWAEAFRKLIQSYERGSRTVVFDYSLIRAAGAPIRGFGGIAPGPAPLIDSIEKIRKVLDSYVQGQITPVRLVSDVINLIGVAVVSGGLRRTALISLGKPNDNEFMNLKNIGRMDPKTYEYVTKGPSYDRKDWAWASNNSIALWDHDDFRHLPSIAEGIRENGEPGVVNFLNIQKYGRIGDEISLDRAIGINPCGEQPLEDKELCCLSEVFYTNCPNEFDLYEAVEHATLYASIISLLPTHEPLTNAVIERNRRVGVSMSGVAEAIQKQPTSEIIRRLRKGYKIARAVNTLHAARCDVAPSVRVTTVKPSGSVSLVAGSSAGLHYPMYGRYLRRMRVQNQSPIIPFLIDAGIPHEEAKVEPNTTIFEFPVNLGPIRGQREVSMFTKGNLAAMMQRHWSDNATSVTVTFDKKKEGRDVEDFLAMMMPNLKSLSMMAEHDPDDEDGVAYAQLPIEEITLKEYEDRKKKIKPIDWRNFQQERVEQELFCDGDTCQIQYV